MLYLNLLNRLFGKNKGVGREELVSYSKESEVRKQEIEEQALTDSFETESFEGWENKDSAKLLNKMDQRFTNTTSSSFLKYASYSFMLVLVISAGVIIYTSTLSKKEEIVEVKPTLVNNNDIIERTDSIFNKEVERFEYKPRELQISKKELVKLDEEPIVETKIDTVIEVVFPLDVEPITPINVSIPEKSTLIYKSKKEIYLHNLKLVDYTIYRNAPIKVEQYKLTGTSANKEGRDSQVDEMTWQEVDIPYIDYLDKTMQLFEKEKYKKALVRFDHILSFYKDDVNAQFYAGLCYFNLEQNEKALNAFNHSYTLDFGNFREEAEWLIYLVYAESNTNKAKNQLKKIIEGNGYYTERAKLDINKY